MAENTHEGLTALFRRTLESDSIAGGIIRARRANTSNPWSEDEERRRSKEYMEDYVRDSDQAVKLLARSGRRD